VTLLGFAKAVEKEEKEKCKQRTVILPREFGSSGIRNLSPSAARNCLEIF
jgi:hypothetical protein